MDTQPIDTRLQFKIARVRNTRAEIRKLEAYFSELDKTDFAGRFVTQEQTRKRQQLKEHKEELRSVERDLSKYRLKKSRKRKGLFL